MRLASAVDDDGALGHEQPDGLRRGAHGDPERVTIRPKRSDLPGPVDMECPQPTHAGRRSECALEVDAVAEGALSQGRPAERLWATPKVSVDVSGTLG